MLGWSRATNSHSSGVFSLKLTPSPLPRRLLNIMPGIYTRVHLEKPSRDSASAKDPTIDGQNTSQAARLARRTGASEPLRKGRTPRTLLCCNLLLMMHRFCRVAGRLACFGCLGAWVSIADPEDNGRVECVEGGHEGRRHDFQLVYYSRLCVETLRYVGGLVGIVLLCCCRLPGSRLPGCQGRRSRSKRSLTLVSGKKIQEDQRQPPAPRTLALLLLLQKVKNEDSTVYNLICFFWGGAREGATG